MASAYIGAAFRLRLDSIRNDKAFNPETVLGYLEEIRLLANTI
jgi:hypothetical protein